MTVGPPFRSAIVGSHVAKVPAGTPDRLVGSGIDRSEIMRIISHLSHIDIGGLDATSFHIDAAGNLWLGAATFATAPFRVSSIGALDIGGTDATSFHVDETGNAWVGAATFATAPLRVSNAGVLTFVGSTTTMKLEVLGTAGHMTFTAEGDVAATTQMHIGAGTTLSLIADATVETLSGTGDTIFYTGASPVERLRIANVGTVTAAGSIIANGTDVRAGTNFVFSGDTDTGMYRYSANIIGMAAGGTTPMTVASNNVGLGVPLSMNNQTIYLNGLADPDNRIIAASNITFLVSKTQASIYLDDSGQQFTFFDSGNAFTPGIGGASWVDASGIDIKRDIVTLDPSEALETVRRLRAVWYKDRDPETGGPVRRINPATGRLKIDDHISVGFIAEEVHEHLPQVTSIDNPAEPNGIAYARFTPHIVAALQELDRRLAAIEALV